VFKKQKLSLVFSKKNGLISYLSIVGKRNTPLYQQFYWYNSNGNNCEYTTTKGASGAYVFNPLKNSSGVPITMEAKYVAVYKGIINVAIVIG